MHDMMSHPRRQTNCPHVANPSLLGASVLKSSPAYTCCDRRDSGTVKRGDSILLCCILIGTGHFVCLCKGDLVETTSRRSLSLLLLLLRARALSLSHSFLTLTLGQAW